MTVGDCSKVNVVLVKLKGGKVNVLRTDELNGLFGKNFVDPFNDQDS